MEKYNAIKDIEKIRSIKIPYYDFITAMYNVNLIYSENFVLSEKGIKKSTTDLVKWNEKKCKEIFVDRIYGELKKDLVELNYDIKNELVSRDVRDLGVYSFIEEKISKIFNKMEL